MNAVDFAIYLTIGLSAGWIAGVLARDAGIGVMGNILLGVTGSAIGAFFVNASGLAARGQLRAILVAIACTIILLFIMNQVKRHT